MGSVLHDEVECTTLAATKDPMDEAAWGFDDSEIDIDMLL